MTFQAGDAVILVSAHSLVVLIGILLIMLMAIDAAENGIVFRIRMTFGTGIPFAVMVTGIDGEVLCVVVKSRGYPGNLVMTGLAFGRELGGSMRRIGCLVVIVQVAAHAGIWGVVVIPVVAGHAIVGNAGVRPEQQKIIVVNGEQGGFPPRISGVADLALVRQSKRAMVRIAGLVVIRQVASYAGIRGVVVIAIVADDAIVGNAGMRPEQRKIIAMDRELGRFPSRVGGVADLALI